MLKCFGVFSELTGFARPMSRLQATNRPELLLPSLMPDWHQLRVIFDPSVPGAPAAAINGNDAEPARIAFVKYSLPGGEADRATNRGSKSSSSRGTTFGQAGVSTDPSTQPHGCDGRTKLLSEELQRARTVALSNIASPFKSAPQRHTATSRDSVHPTGATSAPRSRHREEDRLMTSARFTPHITSGLPLFT